MNRKIIYILLCIFITSLVYPTPVTNIQAFYRDGQVFVTWDNVSADQFILYKSQSPIMHGNQLSSAQNLGYVISTSALNVRTGAYLRIDSASLPLGSNNGLFAATSTAAGSFYYAVTTRTGGVEDTSIIYGSNSLSSPISETVGVPRPVWQENRVINNNTILIYVLFGTRITSSIFPAMTSAGSYPFNFGIIKTGTQSPHPMTVFLRPSGAHFLAPVGTNAPHEWILSIDDFKPGSPNTWYYGFHENYDIFSSQNPPFTSGTLYNYTSSRVAYIINWASRNLPVDSTRIYMIGYSMGASGALFNSLMIPAKIAAIFLRAPRIDLSPNYCCTDLWGTYATNLPTNENMFRNQRLNANYLLSINRLNSLPIILSVSGKYDAIGWDEKIPFYDSMNVLKHGGVHFWDMGNHETVWYAWVPNFPDFFSFCTRYRTNLSYPAFSNCSVNDDPGNGYPLDGDSIGQINAYLDWHDDISDSLYKWEITLKTRTLVTIYDTLHAPDSCTADVTLRRLQRFNVGTGNTIQWTNTKNNIVVQDSSFVYTGGLITIPNVKIYKNLNTLKLINTPIGIKNVNNMIPERFGLYQNFPNPFNPKSKIKYQIAKTQSKNQNVILAVYNALGEEIVVLVNEEQSAGTYEVEWYASEYPSGVYFYRLTTKGFSETKRMILLK